MSSSQPKKCSTAPAVLESTPPAPVPRSDSDWPPFMNTRIYLEVELTRLQDNVGDPDIPMLELRGRIPVHRLSRFEYSMIMGLEALLNEKAKG